MRWLPAPPGKGTGGGQPQSSTCKELITFMALHGGLGQVGALDSIVDHAIVPEPGVSMALSPGDREDVSNLFLE
ncbi:hypothetical protein Taro_014093, partial [Colocasia esculenta]|nr:hypothetical protein [Colocasia esculenta]